MKKIISSLFLTHLLAVTIPIVSLYVTPLCYAGPVYFNTSDSVSFWCDEQKLEMNLDHKNGKLAAICTLLKTPEHDGKSRQTAFEIDVNGKLFTKYVLDLIRFGRTHFPDTKDGESDAKNVLIICEEMGLPLAEDYICKNVLHTKSRREIARENGEFQIKIEHLLGDFAEIETGSHLSGSPIAPTHVIGYEISTHVVTQEAYTHLMKKNPSRFASGRYCKEGFESISTGDKEYPAHVSTCRDYPVEMISWYQANEFVRKLNELFDSVEYEYFLPSALELEIALRGGATTQYPGGDDPSNVNEYAYTSADSHEQTHPTQSKKPNDLGVYIDSVGEWTSTEVNHEILVTGTSFKKSADPSYGYAYTGSSVPTGTYVDVGFRVMRRKRT